MGAALASKFIEPSSHTDSTLVHERATKNPQQTIKIIAFINQINLQEFIGG